MVKIYTYAPAAIVHHNESVFEGYDIMFTPFVSSIEEAEHWWYMRQTVRYQTITKIFWPLFANEVGHYTFVLRQDDFHARNKYGEVIDTTELLKRDER